MQPLEECIHHWLCGLPASGISTGICKKCGAERTFKDPDMEVAWTKKKARSFAVRRRGRYSKTPTELTAE